MDMRDLVREHPLLAILRGVPLEKTVDYADAVMNGGVSFFEVALNSPDAFRQIRLLRQKFGDRALVGAGTAVTPELAQKALDAGAQFLLAPSAPEDVLAFCSSRGVYFLPGVLSPTDVTLCLRYGFRTMKLFPAGDLPRGYVKSLKGPFDGTEYVAIGGVRPDNAREFLDSGCIGVGLGSNLIPRECVASGDWDRAAASVAGLSRSLK